MTIHYIYHRFPHHSPHSGYDRITQYLPGRRIELTPVWKSIVSMMPKRTVDRLIRSASTTAYKEDQLSLELKAASRMVFGRGDIFFVLYADNYYSYLKEIPNPGKNLVVGAYHHPPSFFMTTLKNKSRIQKLDAIMAVSRGSQAYYQDLAGPEKVFFVPHGVDAEFFRPLPDAGKDRRGSKRCLSVGWWLRDLEMLKEAIRLMNDIDPSVSFTIVIFERFFKEFSGLRNVELLSGISEEALLNLYRNSDLLLLPLKDCTANNAILEAMACGLPVVTTDVGGVRDYLAGDASAVVKAGDAKGMAEVVQGLLADERKRTALSHAVRERAENHFHWPLVSEMTRRVFQSLSDKAGR